MVSAAYQWPLKQVLPSAGSYTPSSQMMHTCLTHMSPGPHILPDDDDDDDGDGAK